MIGASPPSVKIIEVGPRDGLQNESIIVPTATKLAYIRALVGAGLRNIEVTSFVHPKAIPQLADAEEVVLGLPQAEGVIYSALVPNEKGLERALKSGIRRIAVFTAASETFTTKNIGMSIEESLRVFQTVVRRATSEGLSVRGYLSTAFVCPFEGDIAPERVLWVTDRLFQMGVDEVAISDTVGAAAPTDVERVLSALLPRFSADRIALHFHNTYGTALANVLAGLKMGIKTFDAATGGLGGCPFAPGAAGNLATEDLVYMLERMGFSAGVDTSGLQSAGQVVCDILGHPLRSASWQRWTAGGRGA